MMGYVKENKTEQLSNISMEVDTRPNDELIRRYQNNVL